MKKLLPLLMYIPLIFAGPKEVLAATAIYRSIAPGATAAIATGTDNPMVISGATVTFTTALPDNIGVGDAVQYSSTNSATAIDKIAFICARSDSTHYTLQTANGGTPPPVSGNTSWSIFRAYTSLANAQSAAENTGIDSNVRSFETRTGGTDITAVDQQLNFACYANGSASDTTVAQINGWTTSAADYIKIYTPTLPSEVGASQRPLGKWDNTKYNMSNNTIANIEGITAGLIDLFVGNVWIDGLQFYYGSSQPAYRGTAIGISWNQVPSGSFIKISNSIMSGGTNAIGAYFIQNYHCNTFYIYAWNNIVYNQANGFYDSGVAPSYNQPDADILYNNTVYGIYNNTGFIAGYAFSSGGGRYILAKNNIVQGSSGTNYTGNFDSSSSNNIANDTTAPGANPADSATVAFVDPSLFDFHLLSTDTTANAAGANLTNDSKLAFSTDIDGQPRPSTGPWSAGAVQYVQDTQAPTIPTGLTANPVSGNEIDLSWNPSRDNVDLMGYYIYRNGARVASASGTAFYDTALSPSTNYTYSVAAYDEAGNQSALSSPVQAATLPPDTTPPTVASFTVPAFAYSLTVPINAFTATDNYKVTGYMITTSPSAPKATDPGWTSAPPTDYNVSGYGSYTLYAWAKDGAGNVSSSLSANVVVSSLAIAGWAPATSTSLTATPSGTILPTAVQYQSYSVTFSAKGGAPPYNWSLTNAAAPLPEGMSLNPSTGVISSTQVGGQGNYTFQILVSDSAGASQTANFTIPVSADNTMAGCSFPFNSIFYQRVDNLPVDTSPAAAIPSAYSNTGLSVFFGAGYNNFPAGIPFIKVPWNQPLVSLKVSVPSQSDQNPPGSGQFDYPLPSNAPIEGTANRTGDHHILVLQEAGGGQPCQLWEIFSHGAYVPGTTSYAAHWNLSDNALRPNGLSSTDAAGLPVLPLLVNYDETVSAAGIRHPIRCSINECLADYVWPARHAAWGAGACSNGSTAVPALSQISQSSPPTSCTWGAPFGEVYRLQAGVDIGSVCPQSTNPQGYAILTALQKYGMIVADNGGTGIIGTADARWNNNDLACIKKINMTQFEPVNVSSLQVSPDSGQTNTASIPSPTGLQIKK